MGDAAELTNRTGPNHGDGINDCSVSLVVVQPDWLTISLHNMGCALVGAMILLVPFLVLKGGLDSSHDEHECQSCCGPKT